MEITEYIWEHPKFMSPQQVSAFLRFFKDLEFIPGRVVSSSSEEDSLVKDIRTVELRAFHQANLTSRTEAHWRNLLYKLLKNSVLHYSKNINKFDINLKTIDELTLLKYSVGGFYRPHVDNCEKYFREVSAIILLNNDYEGGELEFWDPSIKKVIKIIKPEVGKLIMWPSNYLYPHAVKPVTKGLRYSIVSWMK